MTGPEVKDLGIQADSKEVLDMDDPRLEGLIEAVTLDVHTVFGDGFLFLSYLKNMGLTDILRGFSRKIGFRTAHRPSVPCDHEEWHQRPLRPFRVQVIRQLYRPGHTDTGLSADTRFFDMMGDDNMKMAFFQAFVRLRRASNPEFGRCCYVDSTPLPNDIEGNPFNAFGSHGDSGIQCRLVLVADIASGEPVRFKVIPGNVLDVNTPKNITDDVKLSLGVEICKYVLDAGYANETLSGNTRWEEPRRR